MGDTSSPNTKILAAVSTAAMAVVPMLVLFSVLHAVLTSGRYYAEVLKGSHLLKAFIEGRNMVMDRKIRREIEREVRLDDFAIASDRSRANFERARERYEKAARTKEYMELEKLLRETRGMPRESAKKIFRDGKAFEERRDAETESIGKRIREIEEYREKNEDAIGKAENEYEDAKDKMEEARSLLEEKNREAARIVERGRDAVTARLTGDLERLGPRLTPLLNGKLIDGAVKRELEKQLEFLCSYEKQAELGAVVTAGKDGPVVRVPPVMISLWVDVPDGGRRHLLSQVFVEEIRKAPALEDGALLTAMFGASDTVLDEYLAGRHVKKAGFSIHDGVIRLQPPLLDGAAAVAFRRVMLGASYGGYLKYAAGALCALYLAFLFLGRAPRRAKLAWLSRVFLYPSALIILGSISLLIASRIIFDINPYLVPDAMLLGFAKNIARAAAFYLTAAIIIMFLPIFLAGLALWKRANSL